MPTIDLAPYILPTGSKMNPAKPETAEYFDAGQVAFVMQRIDEPRTRPSRVFTSFGGLGESWAIGTRHDCRHDQNGSRLGIYEVVGTVVYATGEKAGVVPDKNLFHAVFK